MKDQIIRSYPPAFQLEAAVCYGIILAWVITCWVIIA
jgi:hypothetical protein